MEKILVLWTKMKLSVWKQLTPALQKQTLYITDLLFVCLIWQWEVGVCEISIHVPVSWTVIGGMVPNNYKISSSTEIKIWKTQHSCQQKTVRIFYCNKKVQYLMACLLHMHWNTSHWNTSHSRASFQSTIILEVVRKTGYPKKDC